MGSDKMGVGHSWAWWWRKGNSKVSGPWVCRSCGGGGEGDRDQGGEHGSGRGS